MTIVEIGALMQSGVLSGLAILLVYRIPLIWAAILKFIERTREYNSTCRSVERSHTEEMARKLAASLAELSHAITELKLANATICRYREPLTRDFLGETAIIRKETGRGQ